jgi:pullulanase
MYEKFGFGKLPSGKDGFQLFLPTKGPGPSQYTRGSDSNIVKVQVTGDFQKRLGLQPWDPVTAPVMTESAHPQGRLFTFALPDGFPPGYYQYKYIVDFENTARRWVGDPCTKYGGESDDNSAFINGGNDLAVQPLAKQLPWQDLVIYELMLDDFTAGYRNGRVPVEAVIDKLDYLAGFGINAIEFMPWVAWPDYGYSWGYNPAYYFSVENNYITDPAQPLDKLVRLKRLINECHARGIHVILDCVFNHVEKGTETRGFPYYWLWQNPSDSPFIGLFAGGGYGEDLDFANNCTREFIVDVAKYWVSAFGIDGIRFDYARGFYLPDHPEEGLPRIIADLRSQVPGIEQRPFTYIIEDLPDNRYQAIDDTNKIGATNCWYDRMLWDTQGYARDGRVDSRFVRLLNTNKDFDLGRGPVTYLENHDHSTFTNVVGGRDVWYKMQPYLIALFTCPGAAMIHNGQEFGQSEFMVESDNGLPAAQRRVQPRPLRWQESTDGTGSGLRGLIARLAQLRKEHLSLRSPNFYPDYWEESWTGFNGAGFGVDTSKQVVIYHRWGPEAGGATGRFIVVLNCSGYDQWVDIPFSTNGEWRELLNGWVSNISNYRLANERISSNWGRVYYRQG